MEFNYTFEPLGENLGVCVTPEHKFGTDAFLLSDFAAPRRKDIACDLGTGCGIIPLLWLRDENGPQKTYGVEIQQKAIEQINITISKYSLEEKLIPVHADLKALKGRIETGSVDLVTCNPPYKEKNAGIISEAASDKIARHETLCSLEDVCAAAAYLLRFGGRFCLCQRPERLADVLGLMRAYALEPKRIRFVQQKGDTAPWLFLAEGKKGSKPFLQVESPLIIQGEQGFSKELLRIYRKGTG